MPHLTEQGDTKTEKELITPKLVDWLLYNLPYLKERCEEIQPGTSGDIILFFPRSKGGVSSKVERVAIKRATLTQVIDAVEKAIKEFNRQQRAVYRLKYRVGMKPYSRIAKKIKYSEESVGYFVQKIREKTRQKIDQIPESDLLVFMRVLGF